MTRTSLLSASVATLAALVLLMTVPIVPESDATDRIPEVGTAPEGPQTEQGGGYDRPARSSKGSRSEVIAKHGMVATSQSLAAQVGLQVLRSGGNAIDAAVAVNAMLGLVEPHMNGVGGDLFAIIWHAESQQLYALNATGRSPYALTHDVFEERGMSRVPEHGPLTWTVPGAVGGWAELLERFGSMSFAEVLAPAISYANEGFPVTEIIAGQWAEAADALSEWPDSASTYLPGGRPPSDGELFVNPGLARTYETIADGGRTAFYEGPIARCIVEFSEANGGYYSLRDFVEHTSTWVDPVSTSYRGYDVWELPPNSHGITALMMLNMLEGYDVASMGHNSAELVHLIVEAKKLAFADRTRFVADPDFFDLPVQQLISKPYAALRRRLIDMAQVAAGVTAGDPWQVDSAAGSGAPGLTTGLLGGPDLLEHGDTVYLTVVDEQRNAVSLIESIFGYFGSTVVPGDLGFALQNRGTGFSLDPDHLNTLAPHKRSLHTNMPGFVTREGDPFLSFGVMGGNMQPQGQTQVLLNLIDFGMNVQETGDAARFRHYGGLAIQGEEPDSGRLSMESGFSDKVFRRLAELGHAVRRTGGGAMGGYQAILIDPVTGMLRGGTDPRKDGAVVGY